MTYVGQGLAGAQAATASGIGPLAAEAVLVDRTRPGLAWSAAHRTLRRRGLRLSHTVAVSLALWTSLAST